VLLLYLIQQTLLLLLSIRIFGHLKVAFIKSGNQSRGGLAVLFELGREIGDGVTGILSGVVNLFEEVLIGFPKGDDAFETVFNIHMPSVIVSRISDWL